MKKRISLILFTCFISSQALALKYMCQKAVRANSGKKESIKAKLNNYQVKGTLEKNRTSLLNQIDASIKAIKSAKCPMDNPDVTRVTSPLLEMRKIVSDTVSSSAPIKENQTT